MQEQLSSKNVLPLPSANSVSSSCYYLFCQQKNLTSNIHWESFKVIAKYYHLKIEQPKFIWMFWDLEIGFPMASTFIGQFWTVFSGCLKQQPSKQKPDINMPKRKIGSLIIMPVLRNITEEFGFSRCLFVNTGFYLSWTVFVCSFLFLFFIWTCKHPSSSLGCLSHHITYKIFPANTLGCIRTADAWPCRMLVAVNALKHDCFLTADTESPLLPLQFYHYSISGHSMSFSSKLNFSLQSCKYLNSRDLHLKLLILSFLKCFFKLLHFSKLFFFLFFP